MDAIRIKRVYMSAEKADGTRILVDRLWPRGLSREAAAIDMWAKEAAPSAELRKWFAHDPERFKGFAERYRAELDDNSAARELSRAVHEMKGTVTLLYGARDTNMNNAAGLADWLKSKEDK